MEQKPVGQMLIDLNLVNEEQLKKAIEKQEESDRPLGEILLELGFIDQKTLDTILNIQDRRPKAAPPEEDAITLLDLQEQFESADVTSFLKLAKDSGASDLYLGTEEKPTIRVMGELRRMPLSALGRERAEEVLMGFLSEEQKETFKQDHYVDFCSAAPEVGRFRLNVFKHDRGITGVFRFIDEEIWPFKKLKLPGVVENLASKQNGLILVTGPMGSGKSTTLASLIHHINHNYRRHVITIEDPIEVIHHSEKSLVSQREVNTHTSSFAQALRAALREDPDVLVVGEMHDPETVSTAITAAETGHLVFGTLHTQNSYRTILRILDQFPVQKRAHVRTILAGTLRGIVSQQLVPTVDGKSRALAFEVMIVNAAISNLIREDKIWQIPSIMQTGSAAGMCLMDDCLIALAQKGRISMEEAYARAVEKEKFDEVKVRRTDRIRTRSV